MEILPGLRSRLSAAGLARVATAGLAPADLDPGIAPGKLQLLPEGQIGSAPVGARGPGTAVMMPVAGVVWVAVTMPVRMPTTLALTVRVAVIIAVALRLSANLAVLMVMIQTRSPRIH